MNVLDSYQAALAQRGYQADNAQCAAAERLQEFAEALITSEQAQSSILKRWFHKGVPPKGVYLWGGVGRGKSFLMEIFYQAVPIQRKTRLHFHEFMRGVHQQLHELRGKSDPLDSVAQHIAQKYALICFDEFHVSDIADAMILYKLLLGLFEHGVSFVMTSNYPPQDLYPDGLHRDRILPAIALIQERLDVLNVDTGVDYRRRSLEQVPRYLTPNNAAAQAQLQALFDQLAEGEPLDPIIEVENRPLHAIARAKTVLWASFHELCEQPRSQNDYLDLAAQYQAIILSDVPKLTPRDASAARRFTWLVDVLYDHHIQLIIAADCPADELYTQGPQATEFHRTVSRLVEMQSKAYVALPPRQAVSL